MNKRSQINIIEKDISALRPAESTPINEEPKKIFKKANTDDIIVVEFITALEINKEIYDFFFFFVKKNILQFRSKKAVVHK